MSALARLCQTTAGWIGSTGRAVPDDGRLALIGDADGGDVARCSVRPRGAASRPTATVVAKISSGSCSTQPGCGIAAARSRGRRCARTLPSASNTSAAEPVVPWSSARTPRLRHAPAGAAEAAHRLDLARDRPRSGARCSAGVPAEQAATCVGDVVQAVERLTRVQAERRSSQAGRRPATAPTRRRRARSSWASDRRLVRTDALGQARVLSRPARGPLGASEPYDRAQVLGLLAVQPKRPRARPELGVDVRLQVGQVAAGQRLELGCHRVAAIGVAAAGARPDRRPLRRWPDSR